VRGFAVPGWRKFLGGPLSTASGEAVASAVESGPDDPDRLASTLQVPTRETDVKRWRSWSLQRRVLVVTAAVSTVVLVLGLTAFALTLDRILYSSAQDAARVQADQVVGVVSKGELPAEDALREIPGQGSILQVLDSRGRVVAASEVAQRAPITKLRPAPGTVAVDQVTGIPGETGEPHAIVAQGVRDPSGAEFVVVVGAPLEVATSTVQTATGLLAVGSTALLVLLLGLIWRILREAMQPVERIRSEVARITQVRSRGHLTVPPSGDEIARLAETMNLMLDRLEQADATTRRFVSDASHELRSPLATIIAAIEVAARTPTPDPARDEVIASEALRMQRLVDDLLTLAKADDGLPLSRQEVDVDDLVDVEVRRLRATVEFPVTASIAAARVTGDATRLSQAIRNLVDNAARHTTGGVHLGVGVDTGAVVVTVDNDGPPVPGPERERVFDRFARLEEARDRDRGGSGLGLAIVRTVVEAHGGTVRAGVSPTGQCRFEIRLPRDSGAST
jgi:signal transduction histidine kinase